MTDTTILITGGAGYLGSRLIRDLAGHEAESERVVVRILDNLQTNRYESLSDLPSVGRYEFYEGDIMDPVAVRRALEGADVVVHLAALVRTPFSFDHPTWTEHVNHWGTARLVEECLAQGVSRFVLASSASVYGPGDERVESDSCAPIGPYSQSKYNAERATIAAVERGLDAVTLRFGMIYGDAPGVRFDSVPNRFAYLAAIGRSIPLYGDGEQVRPIVHVGDAAAAIRHALTYELGAGAIYNVVETNISVLEMAEAIQELRPFTEIKYTGQHGLARLSLSMRGDAFRGTGWRPKADLQKGYREILERFGRFDSIAPLPAVEDYV